MIRTFTLLLAIFVTNHIFISNEAKAQCGGSTPTYTVDLTGNPDSVWLSPNVARDDTCCGATGSDKCIQFIVTLDSTAVGIILDL